MSKDESESSTYIAFQDVTRTYKQGDLEIPALRGISFSLNEGEFCVIVGPSGAGKTTLLNILGGIDRPTSGLIDVGGRVVSSMNENELTSYRRYDVGFVFQFYNLVQNLTARENVELASQICRDPMDVELALDSVGLADRKDNFPAQLSGGEQQRVAIARALAKNPKLLLCDEPTGALDDATGRQILDLLQRTSRENDMTVILITHNSAITDMADRVIKLRSGEIHSENVNERPLSVDEIAW
jgi:putative ABC transport system ATP-binding protein